jgi:capsular exopolysaccharide synthesis family protein
MWCAFPPEYQAKSLLHVASCSPQGVLGSESGCETSEEFAAYKGAQTALLKSRPVLDAVLKEPSFRYLAQLYDDPAEALDNNLHVETLPGSGILRVTYTSENPERAATILNGVIEACLKEIAHTEQEKRQTCMDQLQAGVRSYDEILRQKRSRLRELQESLGIDDHQTLTLRFQSALAQEAAARQKLSDTRMDVKKTEHELEALKQLLQQPVRVAVSEAVVMECLRQEPGSQKQLALLSQVEEEIQKICDTVLPPFQSSLLAAPEKRRALAMEAIELRKREVRPYLEADLRAKHENETREKIRQLESHLQATREQLAALEGEIKRQGEIVKHWSSAINRQDKPTSDIEAIRNDIAATEATEKKIIEQLEMLKVEPTIPSRVSLRASAQTPRERNYAPLLKLGGFTALAAFGLLFCAVAVPEVRLSRVYRAEDVARKVGVGILGTLPAIPARARNVLAHRNRKRDAHKYMQLAESVDAIRTLLLHVAQTDALRVIMVTSANGGEGKTSLACHLAASLARAWRRTLLIDADLRNPAAHRQFDIQPEPGLSEVLRGEAELDDAIRPTSISRLWLLPAGEWDSHAIQALAQKEVAQIFDRLKRQYDFIVMDSSPVLPVADALSLAQHADGVIVSVLVDVSRAPAVHAATQRLAALGARVLGTVVAGSRADVGVTDCQYPPATSR